MTEVALWLGDLGGVLIGLVVVGALILCISVSVEDAPSFSGFLRRTKVEADEPRPAREASTNESRQESGKDVRSARRSG